MENNRFDLITVLGHTAAGKTAFASMLAYSLGGEIISADSRQVYKGMDIGTGKDYKDYEVEGVRIPVHLIDMVDAGYEYNVYLFKHDFLKAFKDISDRKVMPVLCGGSGLYIESVLRNYRLLDVPVNIELREHLEKKSNEELEGMLKLYAMPHNTTDKVDRKRMIRAIEIGMYQTAQPDISEKERSLNPIVLGIKYERTLRRKRITERLLQRLETGLVEEVEGLLRQGVSAEKMDYYGLEYRYISKYLKQELGYEDMFNILNTAIHQFAKRQMTYFHGMERRGIPIHWIDGELSMEEKIERAVRLINSIPAADSAPI